MMVCRRCRESLPPCITRLYLVSLICKRNQLSCQLIFSVNSESNCSLTLSLVVTNSRSSRRLLLFPSCSFFDSLVLLSVQRLLVIFTYLLCFSLSPSVLTQTADRWLLNYICSETLISSGRLPWSRGGLPAAESRPHYRCFLSEGFECVRITSDVMRIKNRDLHSKMEIILEPCKKSLNASSCCRVCSTRLVFFLLFSLSSVPSSHCWCFQSRCCCF